MCGDAWPRAAREARANSTNSENSASCISRATQNGFSFRIQSFVHTSDASFEGMQANRMADGRTSKRRVDDAELSDAGKRHKSAGELRGGRSGLEGYFDRDEDAGVTFGAEVTAVLDGRCEVLLDYTGDELIPRDSCRWLQPDMKGLTRAGAMGAIERQPLGLLSGGEKAATSTLLSQIRWTTTARRRRRLRHAAARRRGDARHPLHVQPVAPLPELVNSRAFSLEA